MSSRLISMSSVVMLAMVQLSVAQTPLGTEFTYQGQLIASGLPAISSADFQFGLFDAASGGAQIGAPQLQNNLALINGTFTTSLDFGAAAFSGDARWLEVAVRSPAGAGGFTTLSPRQALSATPNATFSRQTRGITVDADGQVGIGTTTPFKKLTVAGDMELGTAPGDPHHMRLRGSNGTGDGFLFSGRSFSPFFTLNDGIHLGYNFFVDAAGTDQFVVPNVDSSCLSLGNGTIRLATRVGSLPPVTRLIVDASGFVGIGTNSPQTTLHVDGDFQVQGDAHLGITDITLRIMGGRQSSSGPEHLIWKMGDYLTIVPGNPVGNVYNPELRMISPVTGDELAGFYRDFDTGNGVMFADDKNFRAPNPADASTDIWYCCPEGPEAAMYVRGTAQLTNGRATIELPDHFRNLASEPGMTVQLTPLAGESKGLAVVKKSLEGIEVVELAGGTGNYEFDWRVEAVRKGWEDYKVIRPWLKSDSDPDKAWQNRLKAIEERRAHGKPSPVVNADTPRPNDEVNKQ